MHRWAMVLTSLGSEKASCVAIISIGSNSVSSMLGF